MGAIRKTLHVLTFGLVAPHNETNRLLMRQEAIGRGASPGQLRYIGTRREHGIQAYVADRRAATDEPLPVPDMTPAWLLDDPPAWVPEAVARAWPHWDAGQRREYISQVEMAAARDRLARRPQRRDRRRRG
jgi:hypothetical protein